VTEAGERRLRILGLMVADESSVTETGRLCEVSAKVTGMTGAGIMLMLDDVPQGSICTTDSVSSLIEDLQITLGEGPCVDAHHQRRPVSEPDLAQPETARWVAFSPPALEAGARAVFGFPIRVGGARLGALNLYRDRPGPMADEQHADAMAMSDVAAQAVLLVQSSAPPGALAAELESSGGLQFVVHQAVGMMAAQLEVSVLHAMIRLRAYAFANDRPLGDVARDVVARELRFDAESSENGNE
jgi:GAF domain-containing protein